MKSTKILITALSLALVMLSGCKKEVFTGIDPTKAGVTDFTFDEDASGKTSIAFYWTADEAIKAGATSFSVQLAQKADFTDIDMYDGTIGKTISATSAKHDAVTFEGLTESTRYFARVRANYARSIYSEWTQLMVDGNVICISVGHGVVVMDFVAPKNIKATPKKYNKFTADWGTVAPCEGYSPEYKKASDSNWTVAADVVDPTFTFAEAEEGTEYQVRARGFRTVDGQKEYTDYTETVSVTTPVRALHTIASANDVISFFGEKAATASNSDIFNLEADVDLDGATIAAASSFEGEFYGNGHKISKATAANGFITALNGHFSDVTLTSINLEAPAFGTVAADGDVANVTFEGSCTCKFADPKGSANYGILCGVNEGKITGCTTAAKINQECSTLPDECTFGGLIGLSYGYVENCSATGSLSIKVTTPTSGTFHWIGGVIGQASGKAGSTIVKNCNNSSAVSLEYPTAAYFVVGGVVGGTPANKSTTGNYGVFDGLVNTGAISDYYVKGGSGSYPNVGGCIGYAEGKILNCENSGSITMKTDATSSDNTWTNAHVGGVAGAVTQGAKDCKNHGTISTSFFQAGGTAGNRGSGNTASACFGGVIGAAGPYEDGAVIPVYENLSNDVDLTITVKSSTGTPNSYYGAVLGYATGEVKNCSNTGNFAVVSPIAVNRVAGVVAGSSKGISDCTNSGAVSLTQDLTGATGSVGTWRNYIGGICGHYTAKAPVTGCTNSGNISSTSTAKVASSKESGMAGIVGYDENGNGEEVTGCSNTGTLTPTGSNCKTNDIVNVGLL